MEANAVGPGRRRVGHVILYTTAGCHLCEQAEALLGVVLPPLALQLEKVDIADDAALVERYGIRIPVVRKSDREGELGWPFDEDRLRQFLAQG